ncbi:MAG: hypothetical protein ABI616_00390 [Pseudomonadota bacterium]
MPTSGNSRFLFAAAMARVLSPALLLIGSLLLSVAANSADATPTAATSPKKASPYVPGMTTDAKKYYAMTWGVDQLRVRLAESNQLVRFDYRVLDSTKAAPLNDRASNPLLLDEAAHAVLYVPQMEKVGPLRQSMPPKDGQVYWMVFSNKGEPVKAGHKVSVVIGSFRADGLVVQ